MDIEGIDADILHADRPGKHVASGVGGSFFGGQPTLGDELADECVIDRELGESIVTQLYRSL